METIYGPFKGGQSCAFLIHPLAKEYRILSVQRIDAADKYEYQIYLFGAKFWRRVANPYFSRAPKYSRYVKQRDFFYGSPAIVNDALHWHIDEIMVFDIINEEFSIRPLPFEGSYQRFRRLWVRRLLVKDDRLCFCIVGHEAPVMDIWVLEDYVNWCWVRKYAVNLDWDMNKFHVGEGFHSLYDYLGHIRVICIKGNELVMFWKYRGVFAYHLKFKAVERIHLREFEIEDIDCYYDWLCGFEAYN